MTSRAPGQGRPKKPTQLKIAEGNAGKRKLSPETEPQAEKGIPEPPEWINEDGRIEWTRISGYLYKAGLLTHIDRAALTAYCQSWGRWCEAERQAQGKPLFGKQSGTSQRVIRQPAITFAWIEMQNCWRVLNSFGMTPAARSGLTIENEQDEAQLQWKKFCEMSRTAKK